MTPEAPSQIWLALAVINTVGLDPAKVNPMGGAIALGHPLGATGAIRSATVVHALLRKKLKYGMVTMCVGTGMGAAGSEGAGAGRGRYALRVSC
jgi:acetyl-CoA acetyltransferase